MPTTSSESSTKAASLQSTQGEVLDEVQQLLAGSEAIGELAITEAVQAFTEVVRAVLPSVVTHPARAVDVAFEFVQQSLNLQRRLLHELLTTLQLAMVEAGWDQPYDNASPNGRGRANRGTSRRRSTRNAA